MLQFAHPLRVPIGGKYFFVIPETRDYIEAPTRIDFFVKLRRAYAFANLVCPADIEAIVEDYICRLLPEGFCSGDDEGRPRAKVYTVNQIREATTEMVHQGDCVESQAVAAHRAETCVQCPMHDRQSCTSCSGLSSWANRLVGRSLLAQNVSAEWLGICKVDGTMAQAKVFASKLRGSADYPETCWARAKQSQVTFYE